MLNIFSPTSADGERTDGMKTPASIVSVSSSTSSNSMSISSSTTMSTHNAATVSAASVLTEKAPTAPKVDTPEPVTTQSSKQRRVVTIDPNLPAQQMVGPYTHDRALEDLPGVAHALSLFLASHMVESEKFCHESDPRKERLYFASGYGLIQCVKALMSYEDEDLLAAINHTRHGNTIAQQHRRKSASLAGRIAGLVIGSGSSTGVGFVKAMTPVERHAELIYAETLFEKALLGIVYSGDWLAFIKEALNLRTTFTIYRQLAKFLEVVDGEARAKGQPYDMSIDADFRSGVLLGAGMSNLVLSLMPSRVLSIVELFGYKGDREVGLRMLYEAGGWSKEKDGPSVSAEEEGVRRSICDMVLLIFHLVLSSFTHAGVDIPLAQKILDWNLVRYPSGVFFLFGHGRIALLRAQSRQAIQSYTRAMQAQDQYANLHHISLWEIALARLALWEVTESVACWKRLEEEATWSKAVYVYGCAVCLLQIGEEGGEGSEKVKQEAKKYLEKVPKSLQRIAGKSIPMEKFVARKARKYTSQRNRLCLPALEFAYFFLAISRSQPADIRRRMLPDVQKVQAKLRMYTDVYDHERVEESLSSSSSTRSSKATSKEKDYENGSGGFWDDFALANFLEGVCWRYIAHPEPLAIVDLDLESSLSVEDDVNKLSKEEAERRAMVAFKRVLEHGPKIELDHHLVYYTHFELGRLRACMGDEAEARRHFEIVLSGRPLEVSSTARKGKYSLESALVMRTHAAVEALDHGEQPSAVA